MTHRARAGFTLIELMIVVAIIAVLAAIAIPSFLRYQLRARATEAVTHVQAIATAEHGYFAEYGTYVSAPTPTPATVPGVRKLPFPGGTAFDVIGWRPEGGVQFQYRVGADSDGAPGPLTRFSVEARADLDEDFVSSFFAYVQPGPSGTGLPGALPGTTCVGTGVYSPNSGGPFWMNAGGPCDAESGRSRF